MVATGEQTVNITVRVPESVRTALDALAEATDRTRQYHALEALKEYIEREGWIVGKIQEGMRAADAGDLATNEEVDATFERYAAYREQPTEQRVS